MDVFDAALTFAGRSNLFLGFDLILKADPALLAPSFHRFDHGEGVYLGERVLFLHLATQ